MDQMALFTAKFNSILLHREHGWFFNQKLDPDGQHHQNYEKLSPNCATKARSIGSFYPKNLTVFHTTRYKIDFFTQNLNINVQLQK